MAQPQWITSSGSLGTIPEGTFYQLPLFAEDPDGGEVYFRVIAGQLPDGIQVRKNGLVEGIPKAIASVQGVPVEVARDITSKFAVRAYTEKTINGSKTIDRLADRTFTLTVTGQDIPDFVTPAGSVGKFYDGTEVEIQILFTDSDPDDNVKCRLFTGELPPGLVLNEKTGLISGIILPASALPPEAVVGYDATAFDEYPYGFTAQYIDKNYQFTLELTDGKNSNIRTFEIYVNTRLDQTADTTIITTDSIEVTSDASSDYVPILITPEGDLGRIRSDNFYAFQFKAITFDNDPIEFVLTVGDGVGYDATGTVFDENGVGFDRGNFSLPPGLTLDPVTGWFYGYIPDQGATEQTYKFAIRVKKTNTAPAYNPAFNYTAQSEVTFLGFQYRAIIDVPVGVPPTNATYWMMLDEVISPFYYFTMTIIGNVETEVIWITETDLGTINNGAVSTLAIEAYNVGGRSLEYRLAPGTNSNLPQGLKLLPSGHIVGKVSFNTFALDGGSTTFDKDLNTRLDINETTFDMEFDFTVNAYSPQTENPGYQLGAIQLTNGGSGYGVVNVTFSAPTAPGSVTATGIVTVTNGKVTGVTITNQGFGYVSIPTVTFDMPPIAGVPAQAEAELSGDRVTKVNIINGGSGYETPVVVIGAPPNVIDAVQATAGEITTVNGVISRISVGNPGRGYQVPPIVDIIGSGSGASARAEMEIINVVNAVSAFRQFTVTVVRAFDEPYNRLYIKAMPPFEDRALIDQLIYNQDVIPTESVYRYDDQNFGVAKCVVYDHAYGLRDDTLDAYANSLSINHYWKNLTLGEIQLAQAIDPKTGKVLYEVIYSRIVDDQVNAAGQSVSKEIKWPYPIIADDSSLINNVYPNSLINMRDQVIDAIGQVSPALPLWMTSKQANGKVLGFTPAWVIAYIKPGQGNRALYNIKQKFGQQLNKIDFKADRYEIDRSQTHNWDPVMDHWIPSPPSATTFDLIDHSLPLRLLGNVDYASTISFYDINYRTLDHIRDLGGIDGVYNKNQLNGRLMVFYQQEGFFGDDQLAWTDYYSPYSKNGYDANTAPYDASRVLTNPERLGIYRITVDPNNVVQLSLVTAGETYDSVYVVSGRTFSGNALYIPNSPGPGLLEISWQYVPENEATKETIFDGNSTRFIAPADQYLTVPDTYDKYLLYPRTNILG